MINFKYNIILSFDTRQPGAKPIIPLQIRTLNKRMDYISSTYSVWTSDVLIDSARAFLIEQAQLNIVVKLKIIRITIDTQDGESTIIQDTIVDDEFIPLFDPMSFTTSDTDLDEETLPVTSVDILDNIAETTRVVEPADDSDRDLSQMDSGTTSAETRILRFTLHPIDFVSTSKLFINKFVGQEKGNKIKVGDALMNLVFAKMGSDDGTIPLSDICNEIIIDPLDNEINYEDIKILPNSLIRSIKALQIRYGMYKHGLMLYYDNKVFYVLRKYAIEHECNLMDETLKLNEINILIGSTNSMSESGSGTLAVRSSNVLDMMNNFQSQYPTQVKDLNITYMTSESMTEFDNAAFTGETIGDFFLYSNAFMGSRSISYIKGGDGAAVDWHFPINQLKRSTKTHEESGTKYNMFYDDLNNPFNASSVLIQSEMNKLCIIELNNFDFNSIKPNKFLKVSATNAIDKKKFDGKHMIANGEVNFEKIEPNNPSPLVEWTANTKIVSIHCRNIENFSTEGLDFTKKFETTDLNKGLFGFSFFNRSKQNVYDPEIYSDPNAPGFGGIIMEEEPNEPPPEEAIVIDISSRKIFHGQRDNIFIPHSSCNLTSCAMAFSYSGLPINFPDMRVNDSGIKEQIEDYFFRKMVKDPDVIQYMRKSFPTWNIKDAGQINTSREIICNNLYKQHFPQFYSNKKAIVTVSPTYEEIIYELVKKRAIVARVRVPFHANPKTLGHIVCICGFITMQQNIGSITSPSEVEMNKVWKLIIDDPYGNPITGYKVTNGNGIRVSIPLFSQWVPWLDSSKTKLAYYEFINQP